MNEKLKKEIKRAVSDYRDGCVSQDVWVELRSSWNCEYSSFEVYYIVIYEGLQFIDYIYVDAVSHPYLAEYRTMKPTETYALIKLF